MLSTKRTNPLSSFGVTPSSLEGLVRPFYKKAPRPGSETPEAATEEEPEAYIEWSSKIKPEVSTVSSMGVEYQWAENGEGNDDDEVSRETFTKRVTNPEDAEQYVDVEVIKSLVFSNPVTGRQRRVRLNNEE